MTEHRRPGRYPAEMRDRAVRMVFEAEGHSSSQWEAIVSVSGKLGMTSETLRRWVRRVEVDEGRRGGVTSDERVAQGERDLEGGFGFLRGRARRPKEMILFIDTHRERFGVEPICRTLQFAPSTYWSSKRRPVCARKIRDEYPRRRSPGCIGTTFRSMGLQRSGHS